MRVDAFYRIAQDRANKIVEELNAFVVNLAPDERAYILFNP
jgi:hypothetical protein